MGFFAANGPKCPTTCLAAQLLVRNGVVAIVSAVSPYAHTDEIRKELGDFIEVMFNYNTRIGIPEEIGLGAKW